MLSVTQRLWQGVQEIPQPEQLARQLLRLRGIEASQNFLRPLLRDLMPDPQHIPGIAIAAERLASAIVQHQALGILADFDVDGATSTALVFRYCSFFGIRPIVDVPDRLNEGFGPNTRLLEEAVARQCQLLLCLDCGTAAAEILNPYHNRLDIVVVDHHQSEADVPQVMALVNPQCSENGRQYFGDLAAVGVTFMLLVATNGVLRDQGRQVPDLKTFLDLVCLGTICDMVPLRGLNRAFVHRGLECMSEHPQPGIMSLLQTSGVKQGQVNAEDISFRIGPKLNAGSRQGFSSLAWQLLTAATAEQARPLALKLGQLNNQRKQESLALASDAESCLQHGDGFVIAVNHGWPGGILGILAGRLSRRFQQPCFIVGFDKDGVGSGSARSVAGVPLAQLLQQAVSEGILLRGGGHDMAGGFVLQQQQQQAFFDFLQQKIGAVPKTPVVLDIEFQLPLRMATPTLLVSLRQLEPFGTGHPEPLFLLPNVRLRQVALMGTEHLRGRIIDQDFNSLSAVLFSEAQAPLGQFLRRQTDTLDLVIKLKTDFRRADAVVAHIEDARISTL